MANDIKFDEPEFQTFYDYWDALRGEALVPLKSEFDPLKVPSLMSLMSVLQWVPPDILYIRLIGTRIVEQAHEELTGTNLVDVVHEPQKQMIVEYNAAQFAHVAVGVIQTKRRYASGKSVDVKYAFIPFKGDGGELDIAIGVHKADLEANRQVAPDDPLLHAEIFTYRFVDIGNGVPDLAFSADD